MRVTDLNNNKQLCFLFTAVRRPFGMEELFPRPFGPAHAASELRAVLPLRGSTKTYAASVCH